MNFESQEAFDEYDEDTEAADESMEAADEADEAADEADEAADEADEGADEADEGVDEADEAADEADEGVDESADGVFAGGLRLRMQDDARQRAWRARIERDRQIESQRAATVRQQLGSQINAIRPGSARGAYSVGPLQGAGVVRAVLPNRRSTMMRLIPAPAPISEVNKLRVAINYNDRRRAASIQALRSAVTGLKAAQSATVKTLTAQLVKSDRELGKRLLDGDRSLDKRISAALVGQKGAIEKHHRRVVRLIKRQNRCALARTLTVAGALPLYSAYGGRDLLGKNNLILTGSLATFLATGPVLSALGGRGKHARGWNSLAEWVTWLSIPANIGVALAFFHNTQTKRFVSGIYTTTAADLSARKATVALPIASRSIDAFKKITNAVAVATPYGETGSTVEVTAIVKDGNLQLVFPGTDPLPANIAYIVDTNLPA